MYPLARNLSRGVEWLPMNGPAPHEHHPDLEIAFDFLNPRELESDPLVDRFDTPADAFDWLSEHHVIHEELLDQERRRAAADPDTGARALGRVRRVRAALRALSHAMVERRRAAPHALTEVTRALRAREIIQLEPSEDGVQVGHRHVG